MAAPWRKNQYFRTKTRPLITLGISGAEIWCRIHQVRLRTGRRTASGCVNTASANCARLACPRHLT
jgi:hypothetical protein